MLNCVCWGVSKQVVSRIPCVTEGHPQALEARRSFMDNWVKHYGWPEMIVADQGNEFLGVRHRFLFVFCDLSIFSAVLTGFFWNEYDKTTVADAVRRILTNAVHYDLRHGRCDCGYLLLRVAIGGEFF